MDRELEIRKLEKQDIPDVVRIHEIITQKPFPALLQELLGENLDNREGVSFVAVSEGNVVGFMMGEVKSGAFGLEKSFWIEMMGVDPKMMGTGIGQAIADRLIAYCRERSVGDIYTTVRWDSVDLLSFFKRLGFDRSNFINLRKKLD